MDKAAHDEDATLKAFQLDENTLDRYAKIGIAAAELVLPLMFYGVWMSRGLRFEETGTFTSKTFHCLRCDWRGEEAAGDHRREGRCEEAGGSR